MTHHALKIAQSVQVKDEGRFTSHCDKLMLNHGYLEAAIRTKNKQFIDSDFLAKCLGRMWYGEAKMTTSYVCISLAIENVCPVNIRCISECLLIGELKDNPKHKRKNEKKKCQYSWLLSTGVSTESQKRTSVLQLRQGFLATRNTTRINVGLARSYVKLLLSSWKTYMCNLMAWYINK